MTSLNAARTLGERQPRPFSTKRLSPSALDRIPWDNLRLLLVLAEAGSFRSAALRGGVSLNTIRAKVDRLERHFGTPLLTRSVEGVELTQVGAELVMIARRMAAAGRATARVERAAERLPSRVRVTATDGLGTFWLMPRVVELQATAPEIRIDLLCEQEPSAVLFRDTDIAIQLAPPTQPGFVAERVAVLHLVPFAAETYLLAYGMPRSAADAADHRLVWQDSDEYADSALAMFVDPALTERLIAVRTNTSSAHYWAVAKGAGIGFLPTYARALTRAVRPLDLGFQLRRDVYLVYRAEAAQVPEVGAAIAWLRAMFDPAHYPWFADDFVHPAEFETRLSSDDRVAALYRDLVLP